MASKYWEKKKDKKRAVWAAQDDAAAKKARREKPKAPQKNELYQPREHKPLGHSESRACGMARKRRPKKGGLGDDGFRPFVSTLTPD